MKEKKRDDNMTGDEKTNEIPSLNDEAWLGKQELGASEHVIEYHTGGVKSQVKVKAHVLSGAVVESIEGKHTRLNKKTGDIDMDTDAYLKDIVKQVFALDTLT